MDNLKFGKKSWTFGWKWLAILKKKMEIWVGKVGNFEKKMEIWEKIET